jgi:hypothetical protein
MAAGLAFLDHDISVNPGFARPDNGRGPNPTLITIPAKV